MRQHTIRTMKMDRNNRTVLMRALYADFCANGKRDCPTATWLRLSRSCTRPAPANCRWMKESSALARNALNHYRNERIASGGYTDAADAALIKLFKAKPPLWPFG